MSELKNDPFFEKIDWEKLRKKQIKPPIIEKDDDDELQI